MVKNLISRARGGDVFFGLLCEINRLLLTRLKDQEYVALGVSCWIFNDIDDSETECLDDGQIFSTTC